MTFAQWIESLQIFAKYSAKGLDGFANISAEHDEIFMGPDPEEVSEEDNARLEELGWMESSYGGSYHRFAC